MPVNLEKSCAITFSKAQIDVFRLNTLGENNLDFTGKS